MRRATAGELRRLRTALRRWRGLRLPNGIPKKLKIRPSDLDPDQLAIGIGVEMEHTKYPELALEIAMAHLGERGDYYERLEKMEKSTDPQVYRSARKRWRRK